MNYAEQQRNPGRHAVGITVVVLLHVLIVYALVTGLARTVVEVVKGPIDVKVIEEIIKKPPPPPEVVPPPPKMSAPPPPFIPPPEVNIAQPVTQAPTITAVTQEAPPAAHAPVIQKAPEAAPPAVRSARVVCPNYMEVMSSISYPREAIKENLEGEVVIEFTVTASGQVKDTVIKSSTNRVFNRASMAVVSELKCQGQGQDIRAQAPISFKLR
ncbi:MAG TPA: energy transducer TonB [Burkholderiaceae bacterium]|nr:energy transducer TonB [Burkholderiaceae bacterium]HQR71933.1 energy transducer TonB [Burkholderiaceae bacterium]